MKMSRVSVPQIGFSVIVDTVHGLEIWTQIIIESGYIPEINVVRDSGVTNRE